MPRTRARSLVYGAVVAAVAGTLAVPATSHAVEQASCAFTVDFNYQFQCNLTNNTRWFNKAVSTYAEDSTTSGGLNENLDRAIYISGAESEYTMVATYAIAARSMLGIPNTTVDLTVEQERQVSMTMDAIALNTAQALTQSAINSLANSSDAVEVMAFQTLSAMSTANAGYGGASGLNEQEKRVCKREPYDCYRVRNTPKYSFDWSARYYPNYSSHNTRRDAHRHCVWTALMTERANEPFAKRLGDAHEFGASGQPTSERDMDLHNNYWGRQVGLATAGKRDSTRADGCRNYINNGTLRWIR